MVEVEEVDVCECDEEIVEEGEGVDCVGCVEILKEDEGGNKSCCCESDIVEGVNIS